MWRHDVDGVKLRHIYGKKMTFMGLWIMEGGTGG